MQVKHLLALLLVAALAAPAAQAAVAIDGENSAKTISTSGGSLGFDVTVDCTEFILQAAPTLDATVTTDLPGYYGARDGTGTFSVQDCVTGATQQLTQTIDVALSPTDDAIGLAPTPFKATVTVGTATAEFDHDKNIQIAYEDGHTMTPDVAFPYEFTDADGEALEFNITIDIAANSRTMVMFIDPGASVGNVDGLFHQIFDVEDGETTRTIGVTWTPPSFAWETAEISFYNYSHCLNGSPCDPTNEQNITWEIRNAQTGGGAGETPDDEESPSIPFIALGLALVAAAFVARRRD